MVAMIVSTMIVVIGLGISSVLVRQYNLSLLGRDSQTAFYSADALADCIIYWDKEQGVLRQAEDQTSQNIPAADLQGLSCGGVGATIDIVEDVGSPIPTCPQTVNPHMNYTHTYTTYLILNDEKNKPLARAKITKEDSCEVDDWKSIHSTIDVNGFNSSEVNDTRRIERGLQKSYATE